MLPEACIRVVGHVASLLQAVMGGHCCSCTPKHSTPRPASHAPDALTPSPHPTILAPTHLDAVAPVLFTAEGTCTCAGGAAFSHGRAGLRDPVAATGAP